MKNIASVLLRGEHRCDQCDSIGLCFARFGVGKLCFRCESAILHRERQYKRFRLFMGGFIVFLVAWRLT